MSTSDDQEPVTALAVHRARGRDGGRRDVQALPKTTRHRGRANRTVRMGNRVLIPVDELRDYFKANVAMPTPAPKKRNARRSRARTPPLRTNALPMRGTPQSRAQHVIAEKERSMSIEKVPPRNTPTQKLGAQ